MADIRCPYCGNSVPLHVEANDGLGTCFLCGARYFVETREADPDVDFETELGDDDGYSRVYAHIEEDGTPYTVVFF